MINLKKILEHVLDYDEYKKTNELHDSLKEHYNKPSIDIPHINTMYDYMGTESRYINSHLWDEHRIKNGQYPEKRYISPYGNNRINENISSLDHTLSSYKTPHALTVYSGTPHDPRELKDKNDIVHHPAYLSTSLSKYNAENFANYRYSNYTYKGLSKPSDKGIIKSIHHHHVLKIHVPEGHAGYYASTLSNSFRPEKEFILPRGTNLKHLRTAKKVYNKSDLEERHSFIHHMEVVP